jgi:hypothetical protein
MKRSLGKLVLLWLLMAVYVNAAQYQWTILKAPTQLHVGEGAVVRYQCLFDNSAGDYTVVFKPADSENYKASMVTQDDHVSGGKRILQFDVLITPRVAGAVSVNLEAMIRHTTFASIEDASIGRDNVRKYDFNDEKVILPSVKIISVANTADLSGEITLHVTVDKIKVRAHEPVHLSLYVRGHGNLDQFIPYDLNISGVKDFSEPAYKDISLQEDGYDGEIRQEFALVADKNYVIPSFELSVFDTNTHKVKILRSQPITIEVEKGYVAGNLLDAPNLGDTNGWKRYGIYALFIVFGGILTEASRWLWTHRPVRKNKMFWDTAKTQKELSVILSLRSDARYEEVVTQLDEGKLALKEAKKRLNEIMSSNGGKR